MLHAKVAAGSLHARCVKFGRTDRREGLILGVMAGIGQISDAPGLDRRRVSLSLSWWSKENRLLILPILIPSRHLCAIRGVRLEARFGDREASTNDRPGRITTPDIWQNR